jgi:hypothetical protein
MRWALLLALLGATAPGAADDEVTLKNGDRVSGKVLALSKGKLSLETPHSGVLRVDWPQVVSLKTDGKVRVTLQTGELLEGKLSAPKHGTLRVETEGVGAPVDVDFSKVKSFNEPPVAWHGGVSLSVRATDGNTHTASFLAAGEGIRETEADLLLVRAVFRYGDRSGDLIERNSYGLAKYLYRFYGGLYGYASVEFLSDKFKDLRLGTVVSVGAGTEILKHERVDLSAEAGFAFFDNNFYVSADESHSGARASVRLRLALPLGFEAKDLFTWYPNFEDTADWQIRNEATIGTALGGGWSLLGGVISEFDNEPPPGFQEYDNTYFAGLGFTF